MSGEYEEQPSAKIPRELGALIQRLDDASLPNFIDQAGDMTDPKTEWLRVEEALADADKEFADTGDVMTALSWVRLANKIGRPIPPNIAAWLSKCIERYRSGAAKTMDAAMGLSCRGRPPRRRMQERARLEGALARMYVLQVAGATVKGAAALVSRLSPDFAASTLENQYKQSGLGARARKERNTTGRRWHWTEIERILSEYPDTPFVAKKAKKDIRESKVYVRPRI